MMNPLTTVDFCVKHQVVKDQIVASCDLSELALELLRLFAHAARRLHTELGWLGITLALSEIANAVDEAWPARYAADLIAAHAMTVDVPGVDSALRDLGAHAMVQRWNVIEVTADAAAVISAIPELWFRLLPALDTPLLEHFAAQLNSEGCP
jgi:hypothetical protein